MDDNKNLEGQEQQNQDPDNKPEEKEPTVEELMAQLAQERANSAKLQNDYNKGKRQIFLRIFEFSDFPYNCSR